MKKTLLAAIVSALVVSACSQTPSQVRTDPLDPVLVAVIQAQSSAQQQLWALSDSYIEETLPRAPLNAMFFGDYRYNHLWPNSLTDDFINESIRINKAYLAALQTIDRSALQGQDVYTYDIFQQNLQNAIEGSQYPAHYLPLNQFIFSPHNLIIQLGSGLSAQPLNSVKDFDDFLQRLDGFIVWMDQAIVNMRAGITKNIVLPEPVVESMLPQMRAQVLDDPTQSALYGPLKAKQDEFNSEDYQRLDSAYRDIITNRLSPVFARMSDFLEHEYLPNARVSHGLSGLPGGDAWYAFLIKSNTTLPLTAEEIHQTGLQEVERIHEEMRNVARQVGFDGDLQAFFHFLETNEQFYFDSSEDVLAAYAEVKQKINPLLPKLFATLPKADYVIRPYPEAQAKSAPGASYIPAAPDGSRPGVFFANTYNLKGQPKYGVETLSIHEASPGHHFQISIQNELEDLPRIRKQNFYTVYAEGWALYAESLGKELGMFTDPYQYYGKLNAELFRAMRLVVDTGIHAKGWSREQAIQYMLDNSTMASSDVASEVERYMIIPGQALAYKTGQLTLQSLRDYAERELGQRFDIKHFHDLILLDGPLPMPLLEQKVKQWVETVKAS